MTEVSTYIHRFLLGRVSIFYVLGSGEEFRSSRETSRGKSGRDRTPLGFRDRERSPPPVIDLSSEDEEGRGRRHRGSKSRSRSKATKKSRSRRSRSRDDKR